jgi:hypothetical protein
MAKSTRRRTEIPIFRATIFLSMKYPVPGAEIKVTIIKKKR